MRILVTGGAGFIGSHLVDRLMDAGHTVVCVDNLYTGRKANNCQWAEHPSFQFIEHDIINPIDIEPVEQIYHLACPASPVHYQADPIQTTKTNFLGTLNVLELAKRWRARVLLASTSEVYGDPLIHPQTEDYRMLENDGRVVSNFIVQALKGIPLTIYGDGSQTRSFCYVSDLVEGLIRLMNGNYIGPVNLGNLGEYTILQLAQTIQRLIDPTANIVFKPLPQDDPQRRQPDIARAKFHLGWEPTVPLEEGLAITIAYFRDYLANTSY